MYTLLITLAIIIAFLLIVVVLLQSGKGEGLAGTFGGGGANFGAAFGARKTADFLSKITWWLGGSLIVLSIFINLYFLPGSTTSTQRESIIQSSQQSAPSQSSLPGDFEVPSNEPVEEKTDGNIPQEDAE